MAQKQDQGEIKIRALPRKNEVKKEETLPEAKAATTPRWIVYVGTTSAIFLLAVFLSPKPTPQAPPVQQQEMASSTAVTNEQVSRHMQESHMRREMMVQAQQLENMKMKTENLQLDPSVPAERTESYGVHLEQQEDAADRIYSDLNSDVKGYAESTPEDKINARLANRKWVNELERRERITFVRNFIRSAYDRGFEVELDQNLVVVGVRKRKDTRVVNIDQVIDKLAAKQGF